MGGETKISWCDATFNPWVGCTKVSPGCANCYAETYDKRVGGGVNSDGAKRLRWGPGAQRVRTSVSNWKQPLKWNREAEKAGTRPRVFCASLADVFDPEARDIWRLELFDLIRRTPSLDWLLLTKRPEQFAPLRTAAIDAFTRTPDVSMATVDWLQAWVDGTPPDNVWLGVTVENQEQAERRIPLLLAQDAAVRFLSCEPLLGPLDLDPLTCHDCGGHEVSGMDPLPGQPGFCSQPWCSECDVEMGSPGWLDELDWLIIGGESGPKARPFDLGWARSLVAQCRAGGVAPFVKQLGACASDAVNGLAGAALKVNPDAVALVSKRLIDRSGADPSEWPTDLRAREFPARRCDDLRKVLR